MILIPWMWTKSKEEDDLGFVYMECNHTNVEGVGEFHSDPIALDQYSPKLSVPGC
jgi:hypothetical protein